VQFQVVNPFDYADWNARLASLGSNSFFNTVEWARVLSLSYGYEPCYIVGVNGGDFVSLLPLMHINSWLTGRRGVALPFSDYCEPVGLDPALSDEVLDCLKELGSEKKWRSFEVRSGKCLAPSCPASATYLRHAIDLMVGEQVLYKGLEGCVRTSLRKGEKSGVDVSLSDTLESVQLFYGMHCETRRRHGMPPQPFSFFKNLHEQVLSRGLGIVVTARYKGAAIAASVFCHFGKQALFKYGASDRRFQEFRGSTLVMWKAIQWYRQRGYAQLSLGRTAVANSGLRRFKLGWGAAETGLNYVKYDFQSQQFVSGTNNDLESGFRLATMLPLSINRLIGNLLYRHMA